MSVLDRIQSLFVAPAVSGAAVLNEPRQGAVPASAGDIEVVVVGLSPGCGATTVASGLALALRESQRACNLIAVGSGSDDGGSSAVGPLRVWRVPRALMTPTEVAEYGAVVARIAGGRGMDSRPTATVWDVPAREAQAGAEAMREVGTVVAVARGDSDPALSELAVGMLSDRYERVLLVANRVASPDDWQGRPSTCLPESRLAARLVVRGRTPGPGLANPLRELAGLLETGA